MADHAGEATLASVATLRAYMSHSIDYYRSIVLADAPIGYWRLSESSGTTAADSSGNARDGTYTATPTLQVAGAIRSSSDKAVTFNGTTQYVSLGVAGLQPASATTVECWFKTTSTSTMKMYRFGASGVDLRISSGFVTGQVYAGATSATITSSARYHDGKWHHAMLTYNGAQVALYVDGVSAATAVALTGTITYAPGGVAIGRDGDASSGYFNGSLDEVAVYGTALSLARAQARSRRATYETGWFYDRSLPAVRYYVVGAVHNDLFYVFGGYTGATTVATVEAYDPTTQTWTSKASMPTVRYGGAAATLGSYIYYMGGVSGSWTTTLFRYEPGTNTWSTTIFASAPATFTFPALVASAAQNRLYYFDNSTTAYYYSIAADTWTSITGMTSRQELAATMHTNGKIYIGGGTTNATVLQEFDPVAGTFTTKAAMTGRAGHGMVSFGGKVWAVTGTTTGQVHSYDPVANTWTAEASMLEARRYGAIGVVRGAIRYAGGYTYASVVTSTHERYQPVLTSSVATLPINLGFFPYPYGDADLATSLTLTATGSVSAPRVPSPGAIKMGALP